MRGPSLFKEALECDSDDDAEAKFRHAFQILTQEAETGNGEAMYILALYYQTGLPPVTINQELAFQRLKRSFNAGYLPAGPELNIRLNDPESPFFDSEESGRVSERILNMKQI